jgi:hypothetical protein
MSATELPVTINPLFGTRAMAAISRSISPALRALIGITSNLRDGAEFDGGGGGRIATARDLFIMALVI